MAIGECRFPGCKRCTVKHGNGTARFRWVCEEHRSSYPLENNVVYPKFRGNLVSIFSYCIKQSNRKRSA